MKGRTLWIASACLCTASLAETLVTKGPWDLYVDSTLQRAEFADEAECVAEATRLNVARTYNCRTRTTVAVTPAATPAPAPAPAPSGALSYSTTFSVNEYPISEGGKWFKSPNPWTYVRTGDGNAFGSNGVTNGYDDSYAYLKGFGPDQTAEAVIQRNAGTVSTTHEVLLMLRMSDDSNNARGYECLFSSHGGVDLVKWTGPYGGFQNLALTRSGSLGRELTSGDRIKCKAIGSKITAYVNDSLVAEAVDSTFTAGQPGVGFFIRAGGINNLLSLTSFTASSQ